MTPLPPEATCFAKYVPHACVPFVYLFTHLLCVFLFDRLEVGPQVHGDFVLGAQQRAEDGVSRHTDPPQTGPFKFTPQVQHLDVQIFNLHKNEQF